MGCSNGRNYNDDIQAANDYISKAKHCSPDKALEYIQLANSCLERVPGSHVEKVVCLMELAKFFRQNNNIPKARSFLLRAKTLGSKQAATEYEEVDKEFTKMNFECRPDEEKNNYFLNDKKIFASNNLKDRKTKIVCTLGNTLNNIREALKQRRGQSCAIMLDTKGPEVRTGKLEKGKNIELTKDQILEITTDYSFEGNSQRIACSYPNLPKSVQIGSTVLMADGNIVTKVVEIINDTLIKVQVVNPAALGERKNMNLPGIIVDLPILSPQDEDDLVNFGVKENVDMIAASFVRSAKDVEVIRKVLGDEGKHIQIISKIENHEGILNFESILAESDGIMVARGDLGMEIPIEKVFIAQKYMIERANWHGKPIITATQMLESMVKNPRPTRAESTDVANAVLDGSDCVMLSGETANGSYPFNSVDIMARLCLEAESIINYQVLFENKLLNYYVQNLLERECRDLVEGTLTKKNIQFIFVFTDDGEAARMVAKYRPTVPIFVLAPFSHIVRQCNLLRGVKAREVNSFPDINEDMDALLLAAKTYSMDTFAQSPVIVKSCSPELSFAFIYSKNLIQDNEAVTIRTYFSSYY